MRSRVQEHSGPDDVRCDSQWCRQTELLIRSPADMKLLMVLGSSAGSGHLSFPLIRWTRIRRLASKPPANNNHYNTLGIKRDAKQKDVKDAFYRLSKLYHPDVSTDTVALQKFQDITAAYETLGTQESRDAYDAATEPLRSQRLSSAPPVQKATRAEDYTASYRMRKRTHEKIRIRTEAETGARDGKQQAPPRHYAAGSFDAEAIAYKAPEHSMPDSAIERDEEISGSASLVLIILVVIAVTAVTMRPKGYVLRGHLLKTESDADK